MGKVAIVNEQCWSFLYQLTKLYQPVVENLGCHTLILTDTVHCAWQSSFSSRRGLEIVSRK